MRLVPNLGPAMRVVYVLVGLGLIALALLAPFLHRPWPLITALVGAVIVAEGAAGF